MKIWVINKRVGILILVLAVGLFGLIVAGRSRAIYVSNQNRDLPIYCVDKGQNDKKISISFDAAWDNSDSEHIKEILGERNIRTTFFVVGDWVDKYPETVKSLSDAGHEIMNHSDSHPHMTELSKEKMAEELNKCSDKIEKVTGVRPTLFRPPYGDYNNDVVGVARENGYYTIQWSVDSLDWKDLSASEICNRVLKDIQPGSIVLFHNAAKHTPEALPTLLDQLIADGYEIVPISELIMKENYTIDPSGMQISTKATGDEPESSPETTEAPDTDEEASETMAETRPSPSLNSNPSDEVDRSKQSSAPSARRDGDTSVSSSGSGTSPSQSPKPASSAGPSSGAD